MPWVDMASPLAILEMASLLLISPFLPLVQKIILALLSLGPIPQHIGLIMDGNRRYARTFPAGPLPVSQGHLSGFNALRSVLEACLNLKGLTTVTVYAFAIDNFSREETEVHYLMELAKRNLVELAGHGEMLARHSVRLRIVGRRELLPPDVRIAIEKAERMTKRNSRATLNVCIPYASRDEIAYAIDRCVKEMSFRNGEQLPRIPKALNGFRINDGDQRSGEEETYYGITGEDIDAKLMLGHSPPLDILVRTSGVCRLSDFMLWQCTTSQLQFTKRYWPLFGLRELVPIILDYQRMKLRSWLDHKVR